MMIKHLSSLHDVEEYLSTVNCSYTFMYEYDTMRATRKPTQKLTRNHCVLSIDWYGTEKEMYSVLNNLKRFSNLYVETCFNTETYHMCFMSTHYSKVNHHRKNQYKW